MLSRKTVSRSVAALFVLATCSPAAGEDLSRSDKLKLLYSNQFAFDRRGVPIITVRIAEGLRQVTISSERPIRLLPDGEDGAEVTAGKRWRITLEQGRAAKLEYYVELARAPAAELSALRKEEQVWRGRKVRSQLLEVGAVFGVKGTVFDNRAYVLAAGPHASAAHARQQAEKRLVGLGLKQVGVLPQVRKRPSGLLDARDPGGRARVRVNDVLWLAPSEGAKLAVDDGGKPRSYWGQIYVTLDAAGTLAVVNALPADRLLAGLVPAEIFPTAPEAALQAQAVAARGTLLAKIGIKHVADPYLLCSTECCQVYAGAGHEHPRTTAAVKATRGRVLLRRKSSRLVDAVYSASCGGHTEHNDNAWPVPADDSLRGRLDADPAEPALRALQGGITEHTLARWLAQPPQSWCSRTRLNRDKFRWTTRIDAPTMDRLVQGLGVGAARELRVLRRGVSGRANLLEVVGDRGRQQVRGELTIRRLLGGLRSSMFAVESEPASGPPTAFIFRGGGWGHGVGMCQTGAIGMAEGGHSYTDILQHYYADSEIKELY